MEPTRLHDIPEYQLAKYPKAIAIASKVNGAWKGHSTQELITTAEKVALGLMRLGVKPGDKVAIASGNRNEWCIVDQALLRMGAINITHLPHQQRGGLCLRAEPRRSGVLREQCGDPRQG
jgi:long-chain acyl-CoA synthetase